MSLNWPVQCLRSYRGLQTTIQSGNNVLWIPGEDFTHAPVRDHQLARALDRLREVVKHAVESLCLFEHDCVSAVLENDERGAGYSAGDEPCRRQRR
jgi:hypothetical protein